MREIITALNEALQRDEPVALAIVSHLMYNPGANTVTLKRDGRILTFYPHVAVMAKVDGEEDTKAQLPSVR